MDGIFAVDFAFAVDLVLVVGLDRWVRRSFFSVSPDVVSVVDDVAFAEVDDVADDVAIGGASSSLSETPFTPAFPLLPTFTPLAAPLLTALSPLVCLATLAAATPSIYPNSSQIS